MALPQVLEHMTKRPGMYFSPVEFDVAAAFIRGFNLAGNGGLLVGFREWLVVKLGYGNNLDWSELALRLAFPDLESPRQRLLQPGEQKRAVEILFGFLEEFWQVRQSAQGLRQIYLDYEVWLRRQDWYDSLSPDWIAENEEK